MALHSLGYNLTLTLKSPPAEYLTYHLHRFIDTRVVFYSPIERFDPIWRQRLRAIHSLPTIESFTLSVSISRFHSVRYFWLCNSDICWIAFVQPHVNLFSTALLAQFLHRFLTAWKHRFGPPKVLPSTISSVLFSTDTNEAIGHKTDTSETGVIPSTYVKHSFSPTLSISSTMLTPIRRLSWNPPDVLSSTFSVNLSQSVSDLSRSLADTLISEVFLK